MFQFTLSKAFRKSKKAIYTFFVQFRSETLLFLKAIFCLFLGGGDGLRVSKIYFHPPN